MMELSDQIALVLAPHPDDEVFGCGGLIHRIKKSGGKVYVLYMAAGTTKDFSAKGESTAEERIDEMEQVAREMQIDGYSLAMPGDQYHLQLDTVPLKEIIHLIERGSDISLEALKPDIVLLPPDSDYNQDHRVVNHAAMAALRPASAKHKSFQPIVLTYELPYHQWNIAESLATPGLFVKLDEEALDAKISALKIYKSQLKAPESPLSVHGVRTLANYRGMQCGAPTAEAYQIKRFVV